MARGINKVQLLGNLGGDPELRQLPNGGAVCNFSLATGTSYKDKEGNWQQQTEWHKVCAFGKLAESCAKNLKKGNRVFISEGSNKTSQWEKEGVTHYKTEVVVKDIIFLDGRESTDDVPDLDKVPF